MKKLENQDVIDFIKKVESLGEGVNATNVWQVGEDKKKLFKIRFSSRIMTLYTAETCEAVKKVTEFIKGEKRVLGTERDMTTPFTDIWLSTYYSMAEQELTFDKQEK